MTWRGRAAGLSAVAALIVAVSFVAARAASLDEAARLDLEGKADLAFAAYLQAAKAGLPDAQFNVAVMLDSGRGVTPDLSQAAAWYARAAAHGKPRAAYNLAQLYEAGEGVPRNAELARAWFEASKLPAARSHLVWQPQEPRTVTSERLGAVLVSPAADAKVNAAAKGVELVWTAAAQPEPAQYYVELRAVKKADMPEIFSVMTKLSSVYVRLPDDTTEYVWQVTAMARKSEQYVATGWSSFSVE